jgi:hypothetical protein
MCASRAPDIDDAEISGHDRDKLCEERDERVMDYQTVHVCTYADVPGSQSADSRREYTTALVVFVQGMFSSVWIPLPGGPTSRPDLREGEAKS